MKAHYVDHEIVVRSHVERIVRRTVKFAVGGRAEELCDATPDDRSLDHSCIIMGYRRQESSVEETLTGCSRRQRAAR